MPSPVVSIPLHPPPKSPLESFFSSQHSSKSLSDESDLLKSIKVALRGSETNVVSSIHKASFLSNDEEGEEELTWDNDTVVLSCGGVIKKKWCLREEQQPIQWASLAWFQEQPSTATQSDQGQNKDVKSVAERPTFGPFTRAQRAPAVPDANKETRVSAVYVFLRSIGKIFLKNGLEFTFAIPFIVRQTWPISPSGVLIQRALEPGEIEEAELSGDDILPTIFCLTSPFAEAVAVGLSEGIIGSSADDEQPRLKDSEAALKSFKSIDPREVVLHTSHRCPASDYEIFVTIDSEKRQLSVWRYVYIKPNDTPVPLERTRLRRRNKYRSISSIDSNRFSNFHGFSQPSRFFKEDSPVDDDGFPTFPELPPLASLPGMPPALSATATMQSLVSGTSSSQWSSNPPPQMRTRRNSLTRNELSVTMDRMVLGTRVDTDSSLVNMEHEKMKPSLWVQKLYSTELNDADAQSWQRIQISLFDHRWDGTRLRSLLAICLPSSQNLFLYTVSSNEEEMLTVTPLAKLSAISATAVRATRQNVWDLFVVRPDHKVRIITHGTKQLLVDFGSVYASDANSEDMMHVDNTSKPLYIESGYFSTLYVTLSNGTKYWTTTNLFPGDLLTKKAFHILALSLPPEVSFDLYARFLSNWAKKGLRTSDGIEFECLTSAITQAFDLERSSKQPIPESTSNDPWSMLANSKTHLRYRDDPALKQLRVPNYPAPAPFVYPKRHPYLGPLLYALNSLAEEFRLTPHRYPLLFKIVPLIARVAMVIRPEWVDYWNRLCPSANIGWPSPNAIDPSFLDEQIPVWPPDILTILYGRISNPDWNVPFYDPIQMALHSERPISFEYGMVNPLECLTRMNAIYKCFVDDKSTFSHKRAENAIQLMVSSGIATDFVDRLPLGLAAPLREAARTCQLAPPPDWSISAYRTIDREDVAISAYHNSDAVRKGGYLPAKDVYNTRRTRRTVSDIIQEAKARLASEFEATSGVELGLNDLTDVRFGQDRRLEEVARMLCSSDIPTVKSIERPELSEHDQAKEQQHQVLRIAERTLALPYGRAMFTFGSIQHITQEAYSVPKLEFTVRLQPLNITVSPEAGKIIAESLNWGEFHNGVAAGLRISPYSGSIESSWIAFNKPSELTPEHAGLLYGLGLTGHLRQMLSWHTFAYLTPKHDLTSIGVLLGLAAANIGNADKHVTKLLAVHTPALLPTPSIDLNVSLMTQAAGLSGVGLLYMGTKDRRIADVCLNQISRPDLAQPDISNEHREAYTFSAAVAFGMIMLGKGSNIPADEAFVARLHILINGKADSIFMNGRPMFDINLTSPAATMSLGLMYLRTERKDIADILEIPDTVLSLNNMQPTFLLMRTIARCLIMWNDISATNEWLATQLPSTVRSAIEARFKLGAAIDDALELAYYNIIAGCCFALGLKYAGTACQNAYKTIIRYYDLYTRLVYSNGATFDHRIKRSAVRDGLNLITLSLSMVMAGTGEITCFRRLRYAYGMYTQTMYHPAFKYGIHVATHMALGLLFLGGGRMTLGSSDAAIACLVTAFFPRFHHVSSDNKSYLQALRHLWVIAVEPRCLVARDVRSDEVVYLPLKISLKEEGITQLISPTLIPDLDKILSIRVDTPRYWPFHLDMENVPRHKANLLHSQTLYVKRRTAFLSYTEDPRGSRSLFVRSRSSAGEAATLDFPQMTAMDVHPAGDLSEFIRSFSNDPIFLAFADRFARDDGETPEEKLFQKYCYAALFDCILQDKPRSIQSHLTLFRYRTTAPGSRYFHLGLQDLRCMMDFYGKIYDRRFSGRSENNYRPPLVRESTISGALYALDQQLDAIRKTESFVVALEKYVMGQVVPSIPQTSSHLAWYFLRNNVPVSTLLYILKGLARDAHNQSLGRPEPQGTNDEVALNEGIREVLHSTGSKMTSALGTTWSVRSLNEIINIWSRNG